VDSRTYSFIHFSPQFSSLVNLSGRPFQKSKVGQRDHKIQPK